MMMVMMMMTCEEPIVSSESDILLTCDGPDAAGDRNGGGMVRADEGPGHPAPTAAGRRRLTQRQSGLGELSFFPLGLCFRP
jgi:hypothetical protein